MLPISSSTLLLVERLYAAVDHAASRVAALTCLESLRRSAEPAAIPKLIPLLMTAHGRLLGEVAETISVLLERTRPGQWLALDRALRGVSSIEHPGGRLWHDLETTLDWIERTPGQRFALLGLACSHSNGFLRAVALKKVAALDLPAALPFLLLRSFDWVPAIRQLARQLLEPLLTDARFVEVLSLLPLIHASERGAPDIEKWRSRLQHYLESQASPAAIATGCHSREPLVRRTSYALALGRAGRPRRLLLKAADDADPVLQHWALRQAEHTLDDAEQLAFLEAAVESRFPLIRRGALVLLARRAPERAVRPLRAALDARSSTLRSTARRLLDKLSPMSFPEHYRQRIEAAEGVPPLSAISGLGETGSEDDAALVQDWTEHPRPRVRRSAYGALAKLAPETHRETLLQGLADPAASVSRLIYRHARRRASLFASDELWRVFRESRPTHARLHALRLLLAKDRWVSLQHLLPASADSDLEIAAAAQQMLRTWCDDYNRSASIPSARQVQRLAQKLRAFEWALDPSTRDTIRSCLESWPE